jgi:hypothetical protein
VLTDDLQVPVTSGWRQGECDLFWKLNQLELGFPSVEYCQRLSYSIMRQPGPNVGGNLQNHITRTYKYHVRFVARVVRLDRAKHLSVGK